MTLVDQATTAADAGFQGKVEQAILSHAATISAEVDTTAYHDTRIKLAFEVLRDPGSFTALFAKATAATGTVTTLSTDADINTAVQTVWNTLAGARV